ncbi:MAG: SRPBCC family protein [Bacteroidota bacterium]
MKALKIIGIALAVLIVIALLLGMFAPKDYHVERQMSMNASKATIFPYLADLKKHAEWEPWQDRDPNIIQEYEGPDGKVGQSVYWQSEDPQVGEGRQEVTAITPNERVEVDVYFLPFEHANPVYFAMADKEGQTEVSWGMQMHFPFPFNAMMVFMPLEKNIGADFDEGLNNLKTIVEMKPKSTPGLTVQTIDYPATTFIVHQETIDMNTIAAYYTEHLPAVFGYVQSKGYPTIGMPRGLYYGWNLEENTVNLAAGVAVKADEPDAGPYNLIEIPAQKALRVDYYGDYPEVNTAHEAMDKFAAENQLTIKEPAIEEYVTDPTTEPDTSKWLTKVTYFYEQ